MTAKILKSTGHIVHRSTFRALPQDELDDPTEKESRKAFDDRVQHTFGDQSSPDDY
jgi:hypothetical protein